MSVYQFIKLSVVFFVSFVSASETKNNELFVPDIRFRVCGAYCGPGWCNNMWLDEDKCDTSVGPEHHKITGDSCADSCCKLHDKCCGQDPHLHQNCNKEIVDCLDKCNYLSLTCTFDGIPTMAGEIELAMDIVENWCCGESCPKREKTKKKREQQYIEWGNPENYINWG